MRKRVRIYMFIYIYVHIYTICLRHVCVHLFILVREAPHPTALLLPAGININIASVTTRPGYTLPHVCNAVGTLADWWCAYEGDYPCGHSRPSGASIPSCLHTSFDITLATSHGSGFPSRIRLSTHRASCDQTIFVPCDD